MGAVIALLVPALLTALVLTQTFGEDGQLVVDEKAIGVAIAAVALALRAPVLVAVTLAVVTTALRGPSASQRSRRTSTSQREPAPPIVAVLTARRTFESWRAPLFFLQNSIKVGLPRDARESNGNNAATVRSRNAAEMASTAASCMSSVAWV